jgi:hypothetical protein
MKLLREYLQNVIMLECAKIGRRNLQLYFEELLLLLYFIENIMINKLTTTEKEFVMIIGISFFTIPYQIHIPRPDSNANNISQERSSAFLVRMIFINWGSMEIEVRTPAAIPIYIWYSFGILCSPWV